MNPLPPLTPLTPGTTRLAPPTPRLVRNEVLSTPSKSQHSNPHRTKTNSSEMSSTNTPNRYASMMLLSPSKSATVRGNLVGDDNLGGDSSATKKTHIISTPLSININNSSQHRFGKGTSGSVMTLTSPRINAPLVASGLEKNLQAHKFGHIQRQQLENQKSIEVFHNGSQGDLEMEGRADKQQFFETEKSEQIENSTLILYNSDTIDNTTDLYEDNRVVRPMTGYIQRKKNQGDDMKDVQNRGGFSEMKNYHYDQNDQNDQHFVRKFNLDDEFSDWDEHDDDDDDELFEQYKMVGGVVNPEDSYTGEWDNVNPSSYPTPIKSDKIDNVTKEFANIRKNGVQKNDNFEFNNYVSVSSPNTSHYMRNTNFSSRYNHINPITPNQSPKHSQSKNALLAYTPTTGKYNRKNDTTNTSSVRDYTNDQNNGFDNRISDEKGTENKIRFPSRILPSISSSRPASTTSARNLYVEGSLKGARAENAILKNSGGGRDETINKIDNELMLGISSSSGILDSAYKNRLQRPDVSKLLLTPKKMTNNSSNSSKNKPNKTPKDENDNDQHHSENKIPPLQQFEPKNKMSENVEKKFNFNSNNILSRNNTINNVPNHTIPSKLHQLPVSFGFGFKQVENQPDEAILELFANSNFESENDQKKLNNFNSDEFPNNVHETSAMSTYNHDGISLHYMHGHIEKNNEQNVPDFLLSLDILKEKDRNVSKTPSFHSFNSTLSHLVSIPNERFESNISTHVTSCKNVSDDIIIDNNVHKSNIYHNTITTTNVITRTTSVEYVENSLQNKNVVNFQNNQQNNQQNNHTK
jgi:hypothetical protein